MYFKGLSDNLEGTGIALGGILLNQHYHASIGVGESFSLEAVYCPPLGQESGEVIYEIESYRNNLYIKDFTESRNSTGKFTVSGKKISGSSREIISVTVFDKALLEQYGGGGNAALAYTHFDVQVTDGSSSSDKTDISSAIGYAPSAYAGKQSAVSVTLDGKTLKAGTDYALSCDSSAVNINGGKVSASAEGTYVLKAAGAGKYEGSVEFFFTVLPASEKMVDLKKQGVITNLPKSVPYSGSEYGTLEAIGAAAGAEVYVALKDGTRLEAGDYAVSVTKGLDKGTATIQVSGQGRYTGTLKKTFKIAAFDLAANAGGAVSVSMAEEAEFSKGGAIPAVSVSFNGTPLTAGADYTLKVSNNKAVADKSVKKAPTVTITGKGNFTKKMTKTFTITQKDLGSVFVSAADVKYKKGAQKPSYYKAKVTVYDTDFKALKANKDYKISFPASEGTEKVELGDGETLPFTTTAVEGGNYKGSVGGSCHVRTTVQNLSSAKAAKIANKAYTGSELTLSDTELSQLLYFKKGEFLANGTDFEVLSTINNVEKGKASVLIGAKDGSSYCGTKVLTFKIVAAK